MSLLDCIEYELNSRGSLPALYSLGGRVTSRLDLDLFGYMVSICKEYDIYHIRTDPSLSSRFLPKTVWCMSISVLHHTPSSYGLDHPWCYSPCPLPWVSGVIHPTASPWPWSWPETKVEERARGKKDILPCFSLLKSQKWIFYWAECPSANLTRTKVSSSKSLHFICPAAKGGHF